MRSPLLAKLISFLLGFLAACVLFIGLARWRENIVTEAMYKDCEQRIDRSVGDQVLNYLPILEKTSELIQSNRANEAQKLLCNFSWWQLEDVWVINKKYNGALDGRFKPILVNAYPQFKQNVDLNDFKSWPKSTLTEMSNFMAEADAVVKTSR